MKISFSLNYWISNSYCEYYHISEAGNEYKLWEIREL